MTAAAPYYADYGRVHQMQWHDQEKDPLKRWFENWKADKNAYFAAATEWLTIEPVKFTSASGKPRIRYVGTIGADHHEKKRNVRFEDGAPEPPSFRLAIRQKYIAPPPEEPFRSIFDPFAAGTGETAHYLAEMQRRLQATFMVAAQVLEHQATWGQGFRLDALRLGPRELARIEALLREQGRRHFERPRPVAPAPAPEPRHRFN